jgi:hypothetical protein
MNRILIAGLLAALAAAPAAATEPAPPGRAAAGHLAVSEPEITRVVAAYNRWVAGLTTLRAGGKATVGRRDESDRVFRFALAAARPGRVRLQGRWGHMTTLFDLAATPEGWTLFLPRDRSAARSPDGNTAAGLLLAPEQLLDTLLPAPVARDDVADEAASHTAEGVRLVVPSGGYPLHRVLWLDPESGLPARLEIRRETQLESVVMTARYADYAGTGPEAFARAIHIDAGPSGWARLGFESVQVAEPIDERRFTILLPPGTREIAVESLDPEFLPQEGGE